MCMLIYGLKNLVGEHEVIDLDINVNTVPRYKFRKERKANGQDNFLTLHLVAEVEVSNKVIVTIKYDDVVVKTYNTHL